MINFILINKHGYFSFVLVIIFNNNSTDVKCAFGCKTLIVV